MAIKQLDVPLADVLIETGLGIRAMNSALAPNNVGATSASVRIRFCATLSEGYDYASHTSEKGARFSFLFITGSGSGYSRSRDLHLYHRYTEQIFIEVNVEFQELPAIS
jgi:hypothetical protein